MSKISMVVFDLSGTTVSDDNAVAKSLYEAYLMYTAIIGVLSGANSRETLERYPHTHILPGVWELPGLILQAFHN